MAVEALAVGFRTEAPDDATLSLSTLHEPVFVRLQERFGTALVARSKALRVFVSYTAADPADRACVARLSEFLTSHGVEARLDQWHLKRRMQLTDWMNRELAAADEVIIVSDERYAQKADGLLDGVGWETTLIQNDMARLPPGSRKYLLIVRSSSVDAGLPFYLRGRFAIHFPRSSPAGMGAVCEELLKELYDVDIAPSIGSVPVYL